MISAFALLVILVSLILLDHFQRLRKHKWLGQFDGPSPTLPIFGNAFQFVGQPSRVSKVFHSNFKKFGSTWRLWLMNNSTLVTADPLLFKAILNSKNHLEKHFSYNYSGRMIFGENSLVTSDVDQWKQDRRCFNEVFNYEHFGSTFKLCVDNWQSLKNAIYAEGNKAVDCKQHFRRLFLMIMLKSFNADPQYITEDVVYHLEEHLVVALGLANKRITKPWTRIPVYWKLFGYKQKLDNMHKIFGDMFMKYLEYFKRQEQIVKSESSTKLVEVEDTAIADTKPRRTLKDLILDESISRAWKYDHAVSLIGGGANTAATVATMTLFFLALNPKCQQKAREDVDILFAENEDKALQFADMSKMKYLRMCILEAMRLHPPIPIIGRTTGDDILMDDGRKIHKGASVLFLLAELSMNPEYFPNPQVFDPERFSDANLSSIKPYTYIPFSKGPRNCIGQKYAETILPPVLGYVLRKFNVKTLQNAADINILYQMAGTSGINVELIFERR